MSKQLSSMTLRAFVAALLLLGVPRVEAKQQCSAAMPLNPNGKWWSYRLVDERKCWYEGKPGLSNPFWSGLRTGPRNRRATML